MSITALNGPNMKKRKRDHDPDHDSSPQHMSGSKLSTTELNSQSNGGTVPSNGSPAASAQTSSKGSQRTKTRVMAGLMSQSSMIAMRVDSFVQEVKLDHTPIINASLTTIERITKALKSIPERQSLSLRDAEKDMRKHRVAIPFAVPKAVDEVKYKFGFVIPSTVHIIGLMPTGICVKGLERMEVAVEMPSTLFQEKDFLDQRAFHKRAFYLACLAAELKTQCGSQYDFCYTFKDDDACLPIISMKPKNTEGAFALPLSVNVLLPQHLGFSSKTLPDRNCVRVGSEPEVSQATPFYNSSLRSNASTLQYQAKLRETARRCELFRDACILGTTWLQQRQFGDSSSSGGFGGDAWALMCALLLEGGGHRGHALFSDRYTSVQIFKAMLQVLSNRDLIAQPLVVNSTDIQIAAMSRPTLFDAQTNVNVLYKMSPWSYRTLVQQAQLSLKAINARNYDNFEAVFIQKEGEPLLRYDETYRLDLSDVFDSKGLPSHSKIRALYEVLQKGLGDRVSLLSIEGFRCNEFRLLESKPLKHEPSIIKLGLLINADTTSRLIDNGPPVEDQEDSEAFRKFWGGKSELRRFRDGRITETLVWAGDKPITLQIIQHLCQHHFKMPQSALTCVHLPLEFCLSEPGVAITAAEAYKLINQRYQELASMLHQMDGLPLPIRSITPADESLRSSMQQNPLNPAFTRPIDVLVQFDTSARWPDDLPAIQYTKIAFLAKIGDLITASGNQLLSVRIGLENSEMSQTGSKNTSFLDLTYPSDTPSLSPVVFRLRIVHEREQQLLLRQITSNDTSASTRDHLNVTLNEYKCTYLANPAHTTAIRNLVTQFNPLSTTIRLLKSWIASHNLSNHIAAPIIEIIASYVFLRPAPWAVPGTATAAFLRCLHLLSHWDWPSVPLIVDLSLSQDMDATTYQELDNRFKTWRKLDPVMNTVTWFVGTNIDPSGTIWTQTAKPARVVAARVNALAKAALTLIKAKGTSMMEQDWKSLFASSLADFDFVIHLKPKVVKGRDQQRQNSKFKNLQIQQVLDVEKLGYDPVKLYLEDLERTFETSVLFFHGACKGVIAGLWKPNTRGRKEWRVRLAYSSIPVLADDTTNDTAGEINRDGILTEIAILGEGIIEKISVEQ